MSTKQPASWGVPVNTFNKKYIATMRKARPASGHRPQTEAEWKRLQIGMIQASYYLYRANGASKREARAIANLIHGGTGGRMLLELAFDGEGER